MRLRNLTRIADRPALWSAGRKNIAWGPPKKQHSTSSTTFSWWAGQEDAQVTSSPLAVASETRQKSADRINRRIYILGLTNVGKFVAHSLAGIPNRPPITLLFHHKGFFATWNRSGRVIEVEEYGRCEKRGGFDVELADPLGSQASSLVKSGSSIISNLIVAVKGPTVVAALLGVAHRLTSESTIVFLQNGMGFIDDVNEKVFTDPDTRPSYVLGVVSHGLRTTSPTTAPFTLSRFGVATMALGFIPENFHVTAQRTIPASHDEGIEPASSDQCPMPVSWETARKRPSTRYLLRTLTRTPVLAAMGLDPVDIYQLKLEKLALQALIDPLTTMFDCKNGELLNNAHVTRILRLLLSEITLVIKSLPELKDVPNLDLRFSPAKLEYQAFSIAKGTAGIESAMLQDIRTGKETEIEYLQGFIVRRGEELGIRCIMNYMLLQMVKGKDRIGQRKALNFLPLEDA